MPTEPRHTYDLEAYCRRVGLQHTPTPTLEGLQQIAFAHVCSIPFEGLNSYIGWPVSLERADIEAKLVRSPRGGYCFEHNGMMIGLLRQLGFQVRGLSGRVLAGAPRETPIPRTHFFLVVTLDGQDWIFDAGVGSGSLTRPIRYVLGIAQETPHDIRRIVHENNRFYHQILMDDHWADLYEFTGEPMPFIDQQTGNWWTSTHPQARFRLNSMVAIARPDGTRAIYQNGDFKVRRGGQVLESQQMGSNEEALTLLSTEFGIELPEGALVWKPTP